PSPSLLLFSSSSRALRALHSFPTRRSSDLFGNHACGLTRSGAAYCWGSNGWGELGASSSVPSNPWPAPVVGGLPFSALTAGGGLDRKSTRLNSSHVAISYAVFCLKKKKV